MKSDMILAVLFLAFVSAVIYANVVDDYVPKENRVAWTIAGAASFMATLFSLPLILTEGSNPIFPTIGLIMSICTLLKMLWVRIDEQMEEERGKKLLLAAKSSNTW